MRRPYFLSFRFRIDRGTDYRQIYLRLKVGSSPRIDVGTGVFALASQWKPYKRQQERIERVESIEQKLDKVVERIALIYDQQNQRAAAEGWCVTSRSVLRQFRGYSPTGSVVRNTDFAGRDSYCNQSGKGGRVYAV